MKIHSSEHEYNHPWSHVTAAVWQKYPNDQAPHVLTVDVLNREVDQEKRVLRTERLLTMRQKVPSLFSKLFSSGEPISYVYEVSEVNLDTNTFTAVSTNLTYRDIMVMDESMTYKPDPKAPLARTLVHQEAAVSVSLSRFSSYCEDAVMSRFKANAHLGRRGLEQVIDRIMLEGQLKLHTLQMA
ncbi:hypothetical protein AMAG_05363 [Allomyces macrogynus ATCC 38327]|uniref:PRELI/MSF1 domain-containing protein n=1 Tax=Allomyces macrogynus (strain ATCC 38327) TaxID=578462 RepID=A0A0L0SBW4_ALLM3|nr:hypothetical protein AMAG_05363 [Allomyces macrogynus ATCC 38327]|eukprot:KNE59914.1 hypothetical protein AMAG_05363 [Allomyces macrogynus ATCC 38327]